MGEVVWGMGRAPAVLRGYIAFLCFPFLSAGARARLNEAGVLLLRFFNNSSFLINKPTSKWSQQVSSLASWGLLNNCNICQTLIQSCIVYN